MIYLPGSGAHALWDGPQAGRHEQRSPHQKRPVREQTTWHDLSEVVARWADDDGRQKGRRPTGADLRSAPHRLFLKSLATWTSILRFHESPTSLSTRAPKTERHLAIHKEGQEDDPTFGKLIFRAPQKEVRHSSFVGLTKIAVESGSAHGPLAGAEKLDGRLR